MYNPTRHRCTNVTLKLPLKHLIDLDYTIYLPDKPEAGHEANGAR